jgi:hypothetical protein
MVRTENERYLHQKAPTFADLGGGCAAFTAYGGQRSKEFRPVLYRYRFRCHIAFFVIGSKQKTLVEHFFRRRVRDRGNAVKQSCFFRMLCFYQEPRGSIAGRNAVFARDLSLRLQDSSVCLLPLAFAHI